MITGTKLGESDDEESDELHFVSVDYGETQVVMAASPEEALEKVEPGEYQEPSHLFSESDMKDYLQQGGKGVFHL